MSATMGQQSTATTTKTTRPGPSICRLERQGQNLRDLLSLRECPFIIGPEIMCTPSATNVCNVWWFNGESPQPKGYVTTLTASSGGSDYTWTITGGTSYAQFSNNSSTIDTKSKDTVVLMPKNDPRCRLAGGQRDRQSQKQDGRGQRPRTPSILNVRKPYELQPNGISDAADKNYGYVSYIHYRILDQTMAVLPATISLNEHFTSGLTNDYAGANWRFPVNCGSSMVCKGAFDPNDFYDQVQGESQAVAKGVLAVPVPQIRHTPRAAGYDEGRSIGAARGALAMTILAGVCRCNRTIGRNTGTTRGTNSIVSPSP